MSKNSTKEHVHGPSCTEEHEVHNHEHHDHSHNHEHDHSHAAGAEHDHVHSAHEGHEHSEDEHLEASHASDEIIFPAEQAARVDFEVSEVMPADFSSVIKCSGEILSAQDDSSPLSAPVSGIVRFARFAVCRRFGRRGWSSGTLHRFQIGGRGRCQRKGFCGI